MNLPAAINLTKYHMEKNNLIALGWSFKIDNAKRRFGVCNYTYKFIGLSSVLIELNTEAEVLDTILHEIAHALTRGDGHGRRWKAKCVELGCRPTRCYTSVEKETPSLRYQAVCGVCKFVYQRVKKISNPNSQRACKCQRNLSWSNKTLLHYEDTRG